MHRDTIPCEAREKGKKESARVRECAIFKNAGVYNIIVPNFRLPSQDPPRLRLRKNLPLRVRIVATLRRNNLNPKRSVLSRVLHLSGRSGNTRSPFSSVPKPRVSAREIFTKPTTLVSPYPPPPPNYLLPSYYSSPARRTSSNALERRVPPRLCRQLYCNKFNERSNWARETRDVL